VDVQAPPRPRLAELVAALSLGIDLGFGQPMEHVLRQTLIALRLSERAGLDEDTRAAVYYTALLINVGCHTDAHEQARWFGDDIELKSGKYRHDIGSKRALIDGVRMIGAGNPPFHRFRIGLEFALSGHREVEQMINHHAAMARRLAEQLAMPDAVVEGLASGYEQWDGKGWPGELAGDAVPLPSRVAQIAEFVEVANRLGGPDAAADLARRHAGRQFDPELAALVQEQPEELFALLDEIATWDAVIESEPALTIVLSEERFDRSLEAIADFIDIKSPYTLGHAPAVAGLAAGAGAAMGQPDDEVCTLRRAALVQDFGRLGVSNAIWDKRGPLGAGEWERVRIHPYFSERMLQSSATLAPLSRIAVQHHERLDGSGYPRGLAGGAISRGGRLLGAADSYQAMREPRPHRPALDPDAAAAELRAEVEAGRLDAEAAEAVLSVAGHTARRRVDGPAGLTAREIDVLRLLARGLSNKEIAAKLVITPKTVGNHVEHIYAKIDASSRAAASLFAVQNGLLPEDDTLPAAS
jgi:HD-GYP domain-containing protein (c-di-GMP phosphodiesterase class II)